jgi:hypothetical protein
MTHDLGRSIMMLARTLLAGFLLTRVLLGGIAVAGVLDPDCTPEKAAKGAAAKATIGVGGRCKPGETVRDTTKRAAGVDDQKKRHDDDGVAKKAVDKVRND